MTKRLVGPITGAPFPAETPGNHRPFHLPISGELLFHASLNPTLSESPPQHISSLRISSKMTVASFFADLYESLTVSDVHAEAPPAEPEAEEPAQEKEEEAEAEEEEEEEPEDPMPALLEGRLQLFWTQWRVGYDVRSGGDDGRNEQYQSN